LKIIDTFVGLSAKVEILYMGKNKKNLRKILVDLLPVLIAILVFISTRIAAGNPQFVEKYYSDGIYPVIAVALSSFSSIFRFSIWDIFWAVSIILLITGIFLTIFRKIKPGMFFLRFIQVVSVLYVWLYISWGYNYYRPDIHTRLGWRAPDTDEAEFRTVFDTIISRANSNYMKFDSSGFSDIDSLVELSYKKNSLSLGINYPNGSRRNKKMVFNSLMDKSGVFGYYGPFFGEIHLTASGLPFDYPAALAHEKAHQFGITNEAEANLFSFVICATSDDKRLLYSGYMIFLAYFINDASHLSDYHTYLKKIDRRVMDDLFYRQDYYKSLQNKTMDKVQSVAYDAYLKTNNIKAGIENYNQVVALVISWFNNQEKVSLKN
jgi:hypothetical protein